MTERRQVIFMPGATGGIGRALARQLAADGYELAVGGRNADGTAALTSSIQGTLMPVAVDVRDESSVGLAFEQVTRQYGRVDTLIYLPGLSVPGTISDMHTTDFDRMLEVNLRGFFLCAKHFLRHVAPDRGGLIVAVSSIAGRTANANAPAYCASKAGLNMLCDALGLQCRKANVRVSIVSPGAVSTPFWGNRQVPHDKFLTPADVADVIRFVIRLPERVVLHDVSFGPWQLIRG